MLEIQNKKRRKLEVCEELQANKGNGHDDALNRCKRENTNKVSSNSSDHNNLLHVTEEDDEELNTSTNIKDKNNGNTDNDDNIEDG